ncbi:MAG: DVUA0089 family protein [Vicinamibacterales bacterium]
MKLWPRVFLALLLLTIPGAASASTISFTGTFTADDDVQLFTFDLLTAGTVTITTFGYAGGTNGAGSTIAAGGFDPDIAVFQGTGPSASLIGVNSDAGCGTVNADATTGACWDSQLVLTLLPAGTYTLALTQYANLALGPLLSDGFGQVGNGNFTGPMFLGTVGSFIDANLAQRTGAWAVDIGGVNSAFVNGGPAPVPEPASMVLLASGLAAAFGYRRRLRFHH